MIRIGFSWLLARSYARLIICLVAPIVVALVVALFPLAAYAATITVNGTTCTLPNAITAANTDAASNGCTAGSGEDTLLLGGLTHSLATGPFNHDGMNATPSVTSTIIISGGVSSAIVERSGAAKYRLLHVGETGDLTLQNVVVRYGDTDDVGGAIFNGGALTLLESGILSNTAYAGGGIFNTEPSTATLTLTLTLTISNSAFIANKAKDGGGGAIYNRGIVTLLDSRLTYNNTHGPEFSPAVGGAIRNEGELTLLNTIIFSNTADYGGGFYNEYGSMASLTNSDVVANTATLLGGGLYTNGSTTTLTNSDFISNTAISGGGLCNDYGTVILTDSDFIANRALHFGGGICNRSATLMLTNSDFIANTATADDGLGGAIYSESNSTVTITDSNFVDNAATLSGGGLANSFSTATLTGSDFLSNTADSGGGLANIVGTATLTDSDFIANTARLGGGIVNTGSDSGPSTLTLTNAEIRANIATVSGGGLYQDITPFSSFAQPTATIVGSRFLDNTVGDTGGAVQQENGTVTLDQSCIINNSDTALNNVGGNAIDADNNWWGTVDGPSGVGPGAGDSISTGVNYAPFLTSAILGCPTNSTLSWSAATYTSGESDGDFSATVILTPIVTLTSVTVVATISGQSQQTLTFPANSSSQPVLIDVVDDAIYTGNRVIQLALQSANGALLGNPSTATLTIIEDDAAPGIAVSKRANTAQAHVGDTITYTYIITNTGNVSLTTISAVDNKLGTVAALAGPLLPNATRTATLTYVVQESDLPGPLVNTVTVVGTDSSDTDVSASANATVTVLPKAVEPAPGLAVSKRANTLQASVGDTITYTYIITNTGNVSLTTVSASDNKLGAVTALAGELLPNATRTATLTYVVQESDLPGPLTNTVTITGTDTLGAQIIASTTLSVTLLPAEEQPPQTLLPFLGK